jgi:hypothetical protein
MLTLLMSSNYDPGIINVGKLKRTTAFIRRAALQVPG